MRLPVEYDMLDDVRVPLIALLRSLAALGRNPATGELAAGAHDR